MNNNAAVNAPQANSLASENGPQLVEIVVPHNVQEGQAILVAVPGGQQIQMSVPPGTVGETLSLWWDPVAQTLTQDP